MDYEDFNDITPYRKKKNNKSKSYKRANHKHSYERVIIIHKTFGNIWANKCSVCGRIQDLNFSNSRHQDLFEKLENQGNAYRNRRDLSIEELHKKFPNVEIYKEDKNMLSFQIDDYIEV